MKVKIKEKSYSSELPRLIYKTTACQKLDINGNRCNNRVSQKKG